MTAWRRRLGQGNVRKMNVSLFSAVPAGAIKVLFDDQNQPWFKRAHVGRFLGLLQVEKLLNRLNKCEIRTRRELSRAYISTTCKIRGQGDENFPSVYGVMYAVFNSRNPKGK